MGQLLEDHMADRELLQQQSPVRRPRDEAQNGTSATAAAGEAMETGTAAVSADNGTSNLSAVIPGWLFEINSMWPGDMEFKQNKFLPAEKQIVTANPDINTVHILILSPIPTSIKLRSFPTCGIRTNCHVRAHLISLVIRRVQLREIPSDILSLKQLQILYLSQNSIESNPSGT